MEPGHLVDIRNTAHFRHLYDGDHPEIRRLYEQAKRDQWNAATDIDWARPVEGDGGSAYIGEIKQLRRERAAGGDETAFRKFFRRDLHAALVPNLQKIGLLTPRAAPHLESLGISPAS